ncbi:MAG: 1-acyl-sn-glycerol-3-phosphate acyltransferase, partial [Alphaproteobacteria bacterium]|nr:1-acyl-sn-glycerol-3-phosphate acyltransferase [Alphaproteobacteria bacterium]
LWRYMGAGPGTVVVEFHPPVTIEQFASRKELANYCRNVTRQGVDDAKTGRPPRRGPLPLPRPRDEALAAAAGGGTAG